jgi:hypothetical protein
VVLVAKAAPPFVDSIADGGFVSVAIDEDGRVYALGSDEDYELVVYRYERGQVGWSGERIWYRELAGASEPVKLVVARDDLVGIVAYAWFTSTSVDTIVRFTEARGPTASWVREFQYEPASLAAQLVDIAVHRAY